MRISKAGMVASGLGVSLVLMAGALSPATFADNTDVIDKVILQVPTACTMSGTGTNSHNAEISNGQSNSSVGETTVKIVCNDNNGFAVYANGYTDNTNGKNVLASANLGSTNDIATGTATTGNSQWAMKLSTISSPTPTYPISIQNGFNTFHTVPDDYALVAKRESTTDSGENPEGSIFKTTYQVYISTTQLADSYAGQVKYTLVHPHTTPTPDSTMLDTGPVVGAKMKTLAAGTETTYTVDTADIKAIRMADSLPAGFTPTEANTVSATTSRHPVYIFFDNTDDAGIMYFYSGGYQIVMNPDSSYLFRSNIALADISGIANWDSSNVTSLQATFGNSTVQLTNLDALSSWDVSNVENLYLTFGVSGSLITAGYPSQLEDISGLLNWDTSSVTDMSGIFQNTSALSNLHGLEFWDISNVNNLRYMFCMGSGQARNDDVSIDLSPIANWDVSNVKNISHMFQNSNIASFLPLRNWDVGRVQNFSNAFNQTDKSTTTTLAGLENWDVSSATNMSGMFSDSVSLTDASAIDGWDVRGVTPDTSGGTTEIGFNKMFNNTPVHPTFTLRPGTWTENGTFVPSS